MFTVEQRDALREHLLRLAEDDERVVAGAAPGSLALDGGDRFSDLDLTFGVADRRWATCSTTGRACSSTNSMRYTLPTSSAARRRTASSSYRTHFSSTSR